MFIRRVASLLAQPATHVFRGNAGRLALLVSVLATATLSAAPSLRTVRIGEYGKLEGALNGWAWVFPSAGTTITTPSPCNNSGCFKNTGGQLCTQGTIPALSCTGQGTPQIQCNWASNWGMVLGLNTHEPRGPWGDNAPVRIGVNYSSAPAGGSVGHFRLQAHVAGDPESKQYCVDNYSPGALVRASDLKSQCWFNTGEVLGSFSTVDIVGLVRVSDYTPVNFDFCITAVLVE